MNIATGQSAKKQHLFNGSRTACNRRMTGMSFEYYKFWAEKYPEECCQKCLNRYNEKSNRIKK